MAAALGPTFGSVLALIFVFLRTSDQLTSWSWRIPLLVAAPLALYIRRRLEDTPVFQEIEKDADRPRAQWRDAFGRHHPKALLVTFAFSWICVVGLYYLGSYVVNYLSTTAELPRTEAALILIEIFPASTRLTAGSVGFNLGVGAPSGFGPLANAAHVVATELTYAPGFFLSGVAVACGVILYALLPETAGRDLLAEHDATQDAVVQRPPVGV